MNEEGHGGPFHGRQDGRAHPAVAASEDGSRPLSIEDAHDIHESLQGHGEAYGRLVRRYEEPIAHYLWRFTRDRTAHEELVQDVFVEAYMGLCGFKGRSPFIHWLRRIATRVGYRYWKDRQRHEARSAAALQGWERLSARMERETSSREAAEMLSILLGQLSPRDRLVLTLMYVEEESVAQIASLTGWTQTMVKVQAYRARRKLRQRLERREERP